MFLRALLAFLIVPVVVAGIVPFTIALCDPFKSTGSLALRAVMIFYSPIGSRDSKIS
jgi:hypothetical protein